MKKTKLLILCNVLIISISSFAYDFKSGDLCYNKISESTSYTVEVTYQNDWSSSSNYKGLNTITIPSTVNYNGQTYSVTRIGSAAFYGCTDLISVTIPNSVTTIIEWAFQDCSSLTAINIPTDHTIFSSEQGVLFNKQRTELIWYPSGKTGSYDIPNSVTTIGEGAFTNCTGLTSITIPSSITNVGSEAFEGTPWLNSKPDGLVYINNVLYSYKGNMPANTTIVIPDGTIAISGFAFYECSNLISVTIPSSVTNIGTGAFCNCTNLTSVSIPSSVTSIDSWVFFGCTKLTAINVPVEHTTLSSENGVLFNKQKTTLIWYPNGKVGAYSIPNSVTTIGESAFTNCTGLTSVTIPSSVTSIGLNAFTNTGLISLVYDVEYCDFTSGFYYDSDMYGSFYNSKKLQSVTIGPNVKHIPAYFIYGCTNVKSIIVPSTVTSIGSDAFANTGLTTFAIPESVTRINDRTFYGCSSLASITIPNTITHIGASAFLNCTNLTSVTIPESLTSIGESAFSKINTKLNTLIYNAINCKTASFKNFLTLTSVIIGNNVTTIPDDFISGCSKVTSITIPEKVTSIGNNAFTGSGLTTLVYNADSCADFIAYGNYDYDYIYGPFHKLNNLKSVTIGTNVKHIPAYFINGCASVTSIFIPENILSIGHDAFAYTGLTSVTIPNKVTTINDKTFFACNRLASVTIPENVTSIGKSAFAYTGLTSVTIPTRVTNISDNMFSNCGNLVSIIIPTSITQIGASAFSFCEALTSITIPKNVTSIGSDAFNNTGLTSLNYNATNCTKGSFGKCQYLKSVTIGSNVTLIPPDFIHGCTEIASITIPESVTGICNNAFAKTELTSLHYNAIRCLSGSFVNFYTLDSVTIGNNVSIIPTNFINGCSKITSITIPESVTSIGTSAFAYTGLTSIIIPKNVTSIGSNVCENTRLESLHYNATHCETGSFGNYYTLDSVTIGNNVTIIPNYFISDSKKVTSITIPESVTNIGVCAFENTGLISVIIPKNVTNIGINAFSGCIYLENLTLSSSLQEIGDTGFAFCNKLNSIIVNAIVPPIIQAKTFSEVNRSIPLYVPAGSLTAYQSNIYWREFLNITESPTGIKPTTIIEGVYAQNGTIVVENETNLSVAIYDIIGRLVASGSSSTRYFAVPNASTYLVNVGKQTMKLFVP